MTHEQLIAYCTGYSTSMTNMERSPQGCSLLSQATAALRELQTSLAKEQRERAEDVQTLTDLRNEIDRLKGKVVSPDVTTMCYCEDCGAATRMGRHLDVDCKTIQDLSKFKASMTTAIAQAVSDALAQADDQNKADIADLQAENARLRKAIEEAPHHFDCNSTYGVGMCCTCAIGAWKRNALEGK